MNAMAKAGDAAEKIDLTVSEAASPPPAPVVQPQLAVQAQPRRRRRGMRFVLMLVVPVALVAVGAYYWATGGRYEETENANLRQAKITISADTTGRVTQADVAENGMVKAGDVLFVVDPEPYRIALEQADAALAGARIGVEQLRAAYSQAVAQQQLAANEVQYMASEFDRQADLSKKGVSSRANLDSAQRDLAKARDQEKAAQEAVIGALAALGGSPDTQVDTHPKVLAAQAARDKAAFDLAQTTVRAPADGMISQASSFKVGQYVNAGTPLFTLVETGDAWIEANFKETQLTHMHVGQKAEVELDTYPGHPFEATIDSIGAGTGAEFSLLPAQNATGNWVKVTQRIPVRLKVHADDAEVALRTGMSADVTVDTGKARGLGSLLAFLGPAEAAAK